MLARQAPSPLISGSILFLGPPALQYSTPSTLIVFVHQHCILLVYLTCILLLLTMKRAQTSNLILTTSLCALLAGGHWATELFCMSNWWTLIDLAENLLLCIALAGLSYIHKPTDTPSVRRIQHSQLCAITWYLLEQTNLRIRNIIHVKTTWQGITPPALISGLIFYPSPTYTGLKLPPLSSRAISRTYGLLVLASFIWLLPALNVIQPSSAPTLQLPALWLSPVLCFQLICMAQHRLPHLSLILSIPPTHVPWILLCYPPHPRVPPLWQSHALGSIGWGLISLISPTHALTLHVCLIFPMWLLL